MKINSWKKNVLAYTVWLFFLSNTYAQNSLTTSQLSGRVNTITTAVPFLMIAPDSRAGGMGDAGAASTPDANSLHWNPAKFAFIEKKLGFAVSYTPWLRALVPDINLAYLSGYNKIDNKQAVAVSLKYFSLGNITFTDVVGNVTGQFNPNEFSIDAAYSRFLSDHFSGGLALRYIYSNLTGGAVIGGSTPSHAGNSIAADISGYYANKDARLFNKDAVVAFGFNISNIGSKISYTETGNKDFIPINLRLGASTKFKLDEFNEVEFLVDFSKLLIPTPPVYDSLDKTKVIAGRDNNVSVPAGIFGSFSDAPGGIKEEGKEINPSVGVEYWYDKQFAVRVGYFYEHKTKGNRKFLTLGAGLRYNVFGIDFAYLIPTEQRNPLENTLRFTLHFDFDAFKSQENKPAE